MVNTVRITIFIFFLLSLLFPNAAISQPPGSGSSDESTGLDFLASEKEMPASISNKALEAAQKYVTDKKKWSMGRNDGGRYVAVGSGDILGNPSSSKFQQKRRNAFTKAMADAKRQIAQYYSQTVAREIAHSYGEGSPSVASKMMSTGEKKAPEEIGILEKTKMLLNAELDAMLKEKGIEPGSKEAEKAVKQMLDPQEGSSFSDKIERIAKAEVGALTTKKIFEDSGNVAVVATYSTNTKRLAAAMMGNGKAPNVPKRKSHESISDWIQSMSMKDLYPMYGVQLTSDYDGNLVIISYGQAAAQSASKMSRRNAVMAAEGNADGYIRSFVGETVTFSNVKQNLEKNARFSDQEIETQVARVQDTSINAIAKNLKIPGIQTVRTWGTQDKRSGTFILGVVRRWDIRSATTALDDAQEFEDVGAGKGGQGLSQSKRRGSQSTSQKTSMKEIVPSNSGEHYSHQSMESEDF